MKDLAHSRLLEAYTRSFLWGEAKHTLPTFTTVVEIVQDKVLETRVEFTEEMHAKALTDLEARIHSPAYNYSGLKQLIIDYGIGKTK